MNYGECSVSVPAAGTGFSAIAKMLFCTREQIAVSTRAVEAFESWRETTVGERAQYLFKLKNLSIYRFLPLKILGSVYIMSDYKATWAKVLETILGDSPEAKILQIPSGVHG